MTEENKQLLPELLRVKDDVADIKTTLAVNTFLLEEQGKHLEEHMRRTDANEELIKIALKPILILETLWETTKKIAKFLAWTAGLGVSVATLIYTIIQITS